MFQVRRRILAKNITAAGQQVVLIDSPSNLYYYTGFTGGEGMFVFSVAEEMQGYLITDSRYYEQVEKECPDVELVRLENSSYSKIVKQLLSECTYEKIAVEKTMNLSQYLNLVEVCPNYSFEINSEAIMNGRMVKDEKELQRIAKAESIGDMAFMHILQFLKPGVSEMDIALELEFYMKKQGASKLSFDTIIASGANSSMPHAQVTNRKIQLGDFVTMDFGCVYQGYCSDMTRTVAVGEPTDEMKKIYQIVLAANQRALEGICEGVSCKDIDALARNYIREQGYSEYFGHGLGHGVGLEIHEEPRFSPKCNEILRENMVITDEPGIYLPGKFGVRIEDLVVVKKAGYEILSNSSKELIIL